MVLWSSLRGPSPSLAARRAAAAAAAAARAYAHVCVFARVHTCLRAYVRVFPDAE
jgi:hypothetical protein